MSVQPCVQVVDTFLLFYIICLPVDGNKLIRGKKKMITGGFLMTKKAGSIYWLFLQTSGNGY